MCVVRNNKSQNNFIAKQIDKSAGQNAMFFIFVSCSRFFFFKVRKAISMSDIKYILTNFSSYHNFLLHIKR